MAVALGIQLSNSEQVNIENTWTRKREEAKGKKSMEENKNIDTKRMI